MSKTIKNIGILYICTWKYNIFWKDFYLSSERHLLKDQEKHYFVFTDSKYIYDQEKNKRIHIFYQKNLGRPDNTLMRFHIFLSIKKELEKMDCLYFFNANLEIKKDIGSEILPDETWLVVTRHFGFYNKKKAKFTYDRNPKSTAFIKKQDGDIYVAWGLNGWNTKKFLAMSETLVKNIDIDKEKWVIALWHDESHLNKYILTHPYKLLDPWYLYPEWWSIPFECKILIRDKSKLIDINVIKWIRQNFVLRALIKIKWLFKK